VNLEEPEGTFEKGLEPFEEDSWGEKHLRVKDL